LCLTRNNATKKASIKLQQLQKFKIIKTGIKNHKIIKSHKLTSVESFYNFIFVLILRIKSESTYTKRSENRNEIYLKKDVKLEEKM